MRRGGSRRLHCWFTIFVGSLGRLRPPQDDNVCGGWVCDFLVEIVRDGFGFRDEQRQHAFGFDGDDVVLILQDAFDGEKFLAGQQQAILMKQVGCDDGVGHAGFIFQADKHKSFGGAGTLADDDAASDAQPLAAGKVAQIAGAANAHGS